MKTPASTQGHPYHPMLIVFPMGLWHFGFFCQVIARFVGDPLPWLTVARYAVGGGILGALVAAIPGFIDYSSLTDKHLKRTATTHMILNLTGVVIWAIVFYSLTPNAAQYTWALILSFVGVAGILYSGWLGGALVHEHGVSVEARKDTVTQTRIENPDVNKDRRQRPITGRPGTELGGE